MKRYKNYLTYSLVGLALVLGLSACSSGDEPESIKKEPAKAASLTFKVSDVNASTRADEDLEELSSLRVILVNEADTVEANVTLTVSSDNSYTIEGLTAGKKSLYIIGNEEAVNGLSSTLGGLAKGTPNGGKTLEAITFKGFTGKIPYSSKYDVTLAEGDNQGTYCIVPAVVKILFNFLNSRTSAVTVNSLNLSSVANQSYLLGHVGSKDYNKNFGSSSYYWVDWLHQYALSTETVSDWITDYELPSGTAHSANSIQGLTVGASSDGTTPTTASKTVYLLESKNGSADSQSYTLQIDVAGDTQDSQKILDLSNVTSLFRNTYVVVNVRLTKGGFEILVDVAPFHDIDLNPDLGNEDMDGILQGNPDWDGEDVITPSFG